METTFRAYQTHKCYMQSEEATMIRLEVTNKIKFKENGHNVEEASRICHGQGKIYFATFLNEEKPVAFLNTNKGYFLIHLLDDWGRSIASLQWEELEAKKVFMSSFQTWKYKGDTKEKTHSHTRFYSPEGNIIVEDWTRSDGVGDKTSHSFDPKPFWKPFPEFGKYEDLLQPPVDPLP